MVSAWWLAAAFVGGGYAGVLVMALMYVASSDDRQRDAGLASTL